MVPSSGCTGIHGREIDRSYGRLGQARQGGGSVLRRNQRPLLEIPSPLENGERSAEPEKITCPILFLSPSNDFHGRIEDLETSVRESKPRLASDLFAARKSSGHPSLRGGDPIVVRSAPEGSFQDAPDS